jgi:hypothetical protein
VICNLSKIVGHFFSALNLFTIKYTSVENCFRLETVQKVKWVATHSLTAQLDNILAVFQQVILIHDLKRVTCFFRPNFRVKIATPHMVMEQYCNNTNKINNFPFDNPLKIRYFTIVGKYILREVYFEISTINNKA